MSETKSVWVLVEPEGDTASGLDRVKAFTMRRRWRWYVFDAEPNPRLTVLGKRTEAKAHGFASSQARAGARARAAADRLGQTASLAYTPSQPRPRVRTAEMRGASDRWGPGD